MADLMKPFARGRAMVRTPPVLARYLDDLAKADRVAGDWDALAAAARGMDDALPPRGPVPPGDYTAAIDSMLPAGQPEFRLVVKSAVLPPSPGFRVRLVPPASR